MMSLMTCCMIFLMMSSFFFKMVHCYPMLWMVSTGIALFIPYILMNGIVFDRYIAAHEASGNGGYLMYMCDSFGYAASVAVLVSKNIWSSQISWEHFYVLLCIIFGASASGVCFWLVTKLRKQV